MLGYEKRVHLLNELLPSLTAGKMSSSSPAHTKVMFLDDAATVVDKIAGATCPAGEVQGNGILPIIEHVLMPISEIHMIFSGAGDKANGMNGHTPSSKVGAFAAKGAPDGTLLSIGVHAASCTCRSHRHYSTYEEVQRDSVAGLLEADALKDAVADALNKVLQPIRDMYEADDEWRQADRMGYPEDWPAEENGVCLHNDKPTT
jgi:tyrosyl-tRNA synthetase